MTSAQIAAQAALHAIGQILDEWSGDWATEPGDEAVGRLMLAALHLVRYQTSTPADELCPVCRRSTGEQVPQTFGGEIRTLQRALDEGPGRMGARRVVVAASGHLGLELFP